MARGEHERSERRPRLGWIEDAEKIGVINLRSSAQDRPRYRRIVEEVITQLGLYGTEEEEEEKCSTSILRSVPEY